MTEYTFLSAWVLVSPVSTVYGAIRDYERHAEWWPGVASVDVVRQGDDQGVGGVLVYVVKSPLPYSLRFEVTVDEVRPPDHVAVTAVGELEGIGVWDLQQHGGLTVAEYRWTVRTTKPWMNILAKPGRPAFSWAHAKVMREGASGLAAHLGVDLVGETSRELSS